MSVLAEEALPGKACWFCFLAGLGGGELMIDGSDASSAYVLVGTLSVDTCLGFQQGT